MKNICTSAQRRHKQIILKISSGEETVVWLALRSHGTELTRCLENQSPEHSVGSAVLEDPDLHLSAQGLQLRVSSTSSLSTTQVPRPHNTQCSCALLPQAPHLLTRLRISPQIACASTACTYAPSLHSAITSSPPPFNLRHVMPSFPATK